MAHDDDEPLQGRCGDFGAADPGRRDDVAGDTNDEQVADPWSNRIPAGARESEKAEHDRERALTGRQLDALKYSPAR